MAKMLDQIKKYLAKHRLDALVIRLSDPHQSEYVAPHWQIIPFLSGFTGSSATIVITEKVAHLWTDSRYWLQAEKELANGPFELQKSGIGQYPSPIDWLTHHLGPNACIGTDASLISQADLERYKQQASLKKQKIVLLKDTLDVLWLTRPPLPKGAVYLMPNEFATLSVPQKLNALRGEAKKHRADAILLTNLDDISWVLHARAPDVECNTGIVSYLVIGPEYAHWFINKKKLSEELKLHFSQMDIEILPYEEISDFLVQPEFAKWKYMVDKSQCQANLYQSIPADNRINVDSPVTMKKAVKNQAEIGAILDAMIQDGLALTKSFYWLEQQMQRFKISEFEFSQKLSASRATFESYQTDSFQPIVGWQGNGAIVHYHPTKGQSSVMDGEGILLVDSGGHYLQGTTDITRTICNGQSSEAYRQHYTMVLKGHIALAKAIFPKGTTGIQLDILARQHLWKYGKNYGHGTGHGVGFCANVHEGPHSIGPRVSKSSKTALEPGMLVTNEPGYYESNEYGIRIENIMLVKEMEGQNFKDFLCFETLTLFPIEMRHVLISELDAGELEWLNRYHRRVREKLIPRLDQHDLQFWLLNQTKPIT